jgi:hypothetical protein
MDYCSEKAVNRAATSQRTTILFNNYSERRIKIRVMKSANSSK